MDGAIGSAFLKCHDIAAALRVLSCVLPEVPDGATADDSWAELDAGVPLFIERIPADAPLPDVAFGLEVSDLDAVTVKAAATPGVERGEIFAVGPGVTGVHLSAPGVPDIFVHTRGTDS